MTSDHLDDQALSAILDGEEPPSPHLDGCADCRARSEQLLAAARLVGRAVPSADVERRDAAIAAAVAVHRPAPMRWRPSTGVLAAAAVLLVVALVLPLVLTRGADSDDDQSSLAERAATTTFAGDDTATGGAALDSETGPATAAAPAGPLMAGDLGSIGDGELRTRVVDALNEAPKAVPDTPISCETDLRNLDERLGRLVLFGGATVNGRPGFVLVFEAGDPEGAKLTAYVVAEDDCSEILQFASFAAP
jgi:hypothetical protein